MPEKTANEPNGLVKLFRFLFGFLQKIGKSLMLPVSVLPVAGMLLGVGGALLLGVDQGRLHIDSTWLIMLLKIMKNSGDPIFANLPLIFAIGVALGLTKNDGVSSLAAVVGYVVMLGTMGVIAQSQGLVTKSIMGINSLDTGVFGGIIIGLAAAEMFNRFYKIELPPYFGFFSGKRFVPIITAMLAIVIGVLLSFIWPPVQLAINGFSRFASTGNPGLAVAMYGTVERLLIPFGLHHIWNVPFFFQVGDFTQANGVVVHGEITRFFAGDPTAGNLGGGYLIKMFGLPAAGLAIWHTARPENRARIASIMISAALTSFLTGITEPLEFSFLFLAPVLYIIHALLTGTAFYILHAAGAKLGYTFSQGFIDYTLFFGMDTRPWLVFVIGPLYALLYYIVFRVAITRLDLKTPGREIDAGILAEPRFDDASDFTRQLVLAFGGKSNISSLDSCITRLRIELIDIRKANPEKLKALGAAGVLVVGNVMQAVFGTASGNIKTDMEEYLQTAGSDAELPTAQGPEQQAFVQEIISRRHDPEAAREAHNIIRALGGRQNISSIEACATTRLRVMLLDETTVDEAALLASGAQGIMRLQQRPIHLLVGTNADQYAFEIRSIMDSTVGSTGGYVASARGSSR
jgi:PTS system glucose-specific IIC component